VSNETFVADVRRFTELAGCTTDRYNPQQTGLYVGLILEEVAELLESIGAVMTAELLESIGRAFKRGDFAPSIEAASDVQRVEMLDACVDIAWVATGCALSQGADVLSAMKEVARANLDKFPGGVAVKDANGKVIKPDGWRGPDVAPFICREG
jgi:predicted HAD superfamily Cof-like phosphohydrolase